MKHLTMIAILLALSSTALAQPERFGITGELAVSGGTVWIFEDEWLELRNSDGSPTRCVDMPQALKPFAGCGVLDIDSITCGVTDPGCILADSTATLSAPTMETFSCDDLRPPTNGDWDAYDKTVKACRGELMAEYVMRAARRITSLWCVDAADSITFAVENPCGAIPQSTVDARAEAMLAEDKALLRRLLRLMATGATQ